MFFEDELEEVMQTTAPAEQDKKLKKIIVRRIQEIPRDQGLQIYTAGLKRIDYAWQSFCKKHLDADFKQDFIRECVRKMDKYATLLQPFLNWGEPLPSED